MLLNLIAFKFVPGILKCLDAWWMSFLFSTVNLYSLKKKKNRILTTVVISYTVYWCEMSTTDQYIWYCKWSPDGSVIQWKFQVLKKSIKWNS